MTVAELIEFLQALDCDIEVCGEVNGDATRTGDYLDAHAHLKIVHPVAYGGYEEGDGEKARQVVVINTTWF